MPQWIHDRARHIQAKNPGMAESTAFAVATQQAHATGKSPKSYGTSEGRQEAKAKYKTPSDDKKTADPGGIGKEAFFRVVNPIVTQDNDDRLRNIIREELSRAAPQGSKQPSLKTKKASMIEYPLPLALIGGFSDYLQKTAQMTLSSVAPKPTVSSQVTARMPRNTLSAKTPQYSQVNPASTPGPAQTLQPVLSPPPVRG
jgi:hypothetical protein